MRKNKTDKNVSESDTVNTAENTETEITTDTAENTEAENATNVTPQGGTVQYEGITNFAYVGPTLPRGKLKSNTILCGTFAQVTEYFKDAIALYPGVEKLFVPVNRLAETRERLQKGGNLINRHVQEVEAAIKAEAQKAAEAEGAIE